ncbi:MAG: hypothetical protein HYS06_03265 [Methylocystis sp.]|nr:hypothetical protein [Methylocystis sp.]
MERRTFLTLMFAGAGASMLATFASPSKALTRLAPIEPIDDTPTLKPEAAIATPEDMETAKIEKIQYWYWRRRRRWGWRRRRWWGWRRRRWGWRRRRWGWRRRRYWY